ncbi:hypothetical protein BAUCODRAFT_144199 [Baudoinia panamericana UAMH 10762]|uniref:Thioredoxin domain-containing protein n=1 Tax=Baudoinia panamericana (strain UAMH 10762) TaxID=717646 RepID=M2N8T2_BAUPA|nr:uncharacterized protein BAUCODRAFT_144199 [Baudoinia panamericana UAMH 10762]EMD00544.1 hypothetical protein BAUCODRAFT_144199 [Baudoinia panamericana UAMH 10762]
MARAITKITNKAEHDAVVAEAERTTPTVIAVINSATPRCKAFLPAFEGVAADHGHRRLKFATMDFNNDTSYMFKFAPNQLPVVVFLRSKWCRSIMGASSQELSEGMQELLAGTDEMAPSELGPRGEVSVALREKRDLQLAT